MRIECSFSSFFFSKQQKDSHAAATLDTEIERCRVRLKNAQDLRIDEELEALDYKNIKKRDEEKIEKLKRSKRDIILVNDNLPEYIKAAADMLKNIQAILTNLLWL